MRNREKKTKKRQAQKHSPMQTIPALVRNFATRFYRQKKVNAPVNTNRNCYLGDGMQEGNSN